MLYQYRAQRRRGGCNPHGCGVLDIGQIIYLQDFRPLGGIRGGQNPICRNPWIVEGFTNREYFPAVASGPAVKIMAGGHLVAVRSLRDGSRRLVADWLVLRAVDCDLEWMGQRSQTSQRRVAAARAAGQAAQAAGMERAAA